jgi:hypothetical protein
MCKEENSLSYACRTAFLWLLAEGGGGPRIQRLAEGVGFEPTRERNPLPVFKTGALNHSATLPALARSTIYAYSQASAFATQLKLPRSVAHRADREGERV